MNKKKNDKTKFINLIAVFSATIFTLLLVSIVVAVLIIFVLFKLNVFDSYSEINLYKVVIIIGLTSLVLGTSLTTLFGSKFIIPFNTINKSMLNLANGDFNTRIYIKGIYNLALFREMTDNFNIMAQKLNSNEILRKNFITDFSHEFKTPISSLKGFAKILKNKNLSDKEREEYLDIIIAESDRLSIMSKNVLTLSKIESQNELLDVVEFNVTEQIRNAVILLLNKWSDKKIKLDLDLEEIEYSGNEELLNLLWINLIDNSIKFSANSGIISISLSSSDNSIKFVIKDNGKGMNQETQDRMFEKFFQEDSSHSTEGNGIGLSLVSQIVRLHHGLISVESKVNKGTTFIVTLPFVKEVE